jgi:integrase
LAAILLEHKAASGHSQPGDFVFCTKAGTPLHYRNIVRRGLEKATEAAGIGSYVEDEEGKRQWKSAIRWHDLRHTFASLLLAQKKVNLLHVSRQLGHTNTTITLNVYGHLIDKAKLDKAARDSLEKSDGNILATTGGNGGSQTGAAQGGEVVDLAERRAGGHSR